MNNNLRIHPRIQDALKANLPIVALESTIISHGMPYPENVTTALRCEEIITNEGALPATIAILNGELVVGLTHEEIDYLGKMGEKVMKVSRRDLPYVLAMGKDGATTVSATMIIASLAGIKIFATGGIGGVHRGGELTLDISADLEELAETKVCVVCAGVKAILDLEKTLEYLETKGVPVIGYQTDVLPAFYSSYSPFSVNFRLDNPKEVAKMLKVKWGLGLKGGILVTNPIPEEYALDEKEINYVIAEAIQKMTELGIKGKNTTPFLLKTVSELTKGKSLEANIQLVYHNCKVASQIAKEYVK